MIDFTTLKSAVKPKDRSDQYLILSGMFSLDAHLVPVTAKQISDVLKLHLRNKVPGNIYDSLRKYDAYVSPKEGSPLRWSLTARGVERLQGLSGLNLKALSDMRRFETDIGIICALETPEFNAVQAAFGGSDKWKEIGDTRHAHVYRETSLRTADNIDLKVVATTTTSMGLTAAAIATTQLVLAFRPRIVAMIGIAAGTASGGKQFGDILVADPSIDYNSGKLVLIDGNRQLQPDPYPIGLNPRLRSVLQKYGSSPNVFSNICSRWRGSKPSAPNRLHVGPVGAADQVIDDPTRIIEIQRNWRKLIGVEMETYGVYRAVYEAPEPKPRFVSFKAVCDFAAQKSDDWQPYAAFMAAEFAAEFFKSEWTKLWPQKA